MREISECGVRGDEGIKEFTVPYKGMDINVCVASGLANARTVMERVKNGEANYHLIEVMACAVAVLWAVASRYGPVTEPKLQERKVYIMLTILC